MSGDHEELPAAARVRQLEDQVIAAGAKILAGQVRGRIVVKIL